MENWFGDADVKPLLLDGELSAQGDRLAAVGNDAIRLYDVPGGPLNTPQLRCTIAPAAGKVAGPTWSPDGRTLAWGEADGIHAMRLDDLGACGSAARPLVVPGASDPDFGPAAGPQGAPASGPQTDPRATPVVTPSAPLAKKGPGLAVRQLGRSVRLRSLRKGLALRLTCTTACTLSATLVVKGRTVARASAKGRAGRPATLRLKARRAKAGRATLTLTARGADGGATVVRRALTLRR